MKKMLLSFCVIGMFVGKAFCTGEAPAQQLQQPQLSEMQQQQLLKLLGQQQPHTKRKERKKPNSQREIRKFAKRRHSENVIRKLLENKSFDPHIARALLEKLNEVQNDKETERLSGKELRRRRLEAAYKHKDRVLRRNTQKSGNQVAARGVNVNDKKESEAPPPFVRTGGNETLTRDSGRLSPVPKNSVLIKNTQKSGNLVAARGVNVDGEEEGEARPATRASLSFREPLSPVLEDEEEVLDDEGEVLDDEEEVLDEVLGRGD